MNQETKKLIKEIDKEGFSKEMHDLLIHIFVDKMQKNRMFNVIAKHSKRIPFDVILDLWDALKWKIEDVEDYLDAPGFNAWYEKTHGKTVQGVS